jgi:hypothetical protein
VTTNGTGGTDGASAEPLGQGRIAALLDLPDDIEELSRLFAERGWSDGLPVVPPTEARVAAMLRYCDRDPADVVALLPPRNGEATVHAVATNAVLAGCRPEHFPLLLTAVQGVGDPAFNLAGVNATTHPCAVLVLVNGPIGREAGVHSGSGCFGPAFPANAAIGRAMRLVLLNVAGATPGKSDRATQGTPAKFAFCAAENEAASPWPPFHTTRGFDAQDSTVTVSASEGPHNIQDHGSNTAEGVIQTVAGALGQAGSNNLLSRGEPLLALGPEHAATIAAEGWTRERLQQALYDRARYPASMLSDEFFESLQERTQQGIARGPFARDELLPIADGPEYIHVIVAGGPGKHSSWMPTFGGMTRPITLPIATRDGRRARSLSDLRPA